MSPEDKLKLLDNALKAIGDIAVEPDSDPMEALLEAQSIAEKARREAGTLGMKFARLKDIQ